MYIDSFEIHEARRGRTCAEDVRSRVRRCVPDPQEVRRGRKAAEKDFGGVARARRVQGWIFGRGCRCGLPLSDDGDDGEIEGEANKRFSADEGCGESEGHLWKNLECARDGSRRERVRRRFAGNLIAVRAVPAAPPPSALALAHPSRPSQSGLRMGWHSSAARPATDSMSDADNAAPVDEARARGNDDGDSGQAPVGDTAPDHARHRPRSPAHIGPRANSPAAQYAPRTSSSSSTSSTTGFSATSAYRCATHWPRTQD